MVSPQEPTLMLVKEKNPVIPLENLMQVLLHLPLTAQVVMLKSLMFLKLMKWFSKPLMLFQMIELKSQFPAKPNKWLLQLETVLLKLFVILGMV